MPEVGNASKTTSTSNSALPYAHGLKGVNIPLDDSLTNILWISVGLVCLIVLIGRLGQMTNAHIRHLLNLHSTAEQQTYWSKDRTWIWPAMKKHLLYAPLLKKRHNTEMRLSSAISVGTLPSRLHALLLGSYFLSNLIYCFYLDYHRPKAALIAELRGRSGHLSLVNMVPLFLLAGRNNPLIALLRVSFDTYNLLHRWIGRVVIIEAVVHTIAWAVNADAAEGHGAIGASLKRSPFLAYGLLGTVSFTAIFIQASSIFRHAFYETFLHVHQLLALAALVGVWFHCHLGSLPAISYIHWTLALWALERSARLFRIIYRNISARRGITRVTIEAMPASDPNNQACRVSFELKRPWTYTPGSHAYIYLPTLSLWMSHPFSIAWADSRPTPYPSLELEKLPSSKSDLGLPEPTRTTTTMYMIIAKRTGMTATLYNKAHASPTGIISVPGLIEGPYGGLDRLHSYGTVVLFAAGVGITHQLSHVRDLLLSSAPPNPDANANSLSSSTTATRKISLIWTVKTTETLEWVRPWMDEILRLPGRKQILTITIFVTRPRCAREVVSRSETVLMYPGRCNPSALVEKEMDARVGAMAVSVCGPGSFADDVRAAVREVGVGKGTVDFVEEAFTW